MAPMSKYEEYSRIIADALDDFKLKEVTEYLVSNSNLPGPRANLELASAFADYFDTWKGNDKLLEFLFELANISSLDAPTDDPREILPFCAVQAFGSLYLKVDEPQRLQILDTLKKAMNDRRWRMREAIAMSFQRIAEKDFHVVQELFTSLYPGSGFLEKRAFIAALAHPPILKSRENVLFCLKISEDILNEIISLDENQRKSEEFTVLSKGLEYAISVFVENLPEEGFDMLKRFAAVGNKDIKRILKSNLGKARLTKKYGDKVREILEIVENTK